VIDEADLVKEIVDFFNASMAGGLVRQDFARRYPQRDLSSKVV
jgi:hypothetical protein